MIGLGYMAQAALGTSVIVDGLACTQQTVANMTVQVAPGSLASLQSIDATAFGSLALNTNPLVKMCINQAVWTSTAMTAPVSSGQSVNYLIEASFGETDTTPVALPYYNASNPAQPYSGPGNSGTAQNTQRLQTVLLQAKAGVAATTGSQTTPAPDSGYVGLWVVTIAFGATSITNSNITVYPTAPFIPAKLGPGMLPGFSNVVVFSSSGSWTVPNGVTKARVRVWGAGGGSGGTWNAATASQAGAAGGYAESILTGLTPGTVYGVTVGAGGTAGVGASTPTAGGNGGTSSFSTLLSATGGNGGIGSNSGGAPGVATPGSGAGGTTWNLSGGYGNSSMVLTGYGSWTAEGGIAPFTGIPAHSGVSSVTATGAPGIYPGGGAGGGANQSNGAAGAGGCVIVEY